MLWIPVTLVVVTLGFSELLRQFGRPATGVFGAVLDICLAAGCVALAVLFIAGLEIDTAQRVLDWLVSGWKMYPPAITAALAALGLLLAMGGATRVVDRVALADPRGPLPDTLTPALACGLGLVLLALVYQRL